MKALVTGVTGQLGYDLIKELLKCGHDVVGVGRSIECPTDYSYQILDLTDAKAVETLLVEISPDVVFHCAAWTVVDLAEEEENYTKVRAINVEGTRNLVKVCKNINAKMIHVSTDYVFDGQGDKPWDEECKDLHPLNFYGKTKLEAEQIVEDNLKKYYILRIAWLFGANGNNFVKTMLSLGKKYETVRVVCDQIGTPTYTHDLARLMVDMAKTDKYGIYHVTNEGGYISWYEFACEIFEQIKSKTKVVPVTTEEYGRSKAARPHNSRLSTHKLIDAGFEPLPDWRDALQRYLEEIDI